MGFAGPEKRREHQSKWYSTELIGRKKSMKNKAAQQARLFSLADYQQVESFPALFRSHRKVSGRKKVTNGEREGGPRKRAVSIM